jgi:Exopolysaccharide biosynthesis protein YbjH
MKRPSWLPGARRLAPVLAAAGVVLAVPARAEVDGAVAQALVQRLTAAGFENVAVHAKDERVVVTYENRRYRWQVTGVGAALATVAGQVPGDTEIVLIPQVQGVPQMRLAVRASDYEAYNTGQLSDRDFRRRLTATYTGTEAARELCPAGANRSYGRTDVAAGLRLYGSFYTPATDAGLEVRALTEADTTLGKGLGVAARALVPTKSLDPFLGQLQLSWVHRPADRWFLGAAIGRLDQDMDAATLETAISSSDARHLLRAQATVGRDRALDLGERAYLVTYAFRVARPEVELSLTAGRFWEGDRGIEAQLVSGFGERRIALAVGRSGSVTRARIGFRTPLGPRRQPSPSGMRLKIKDYFSVRYTAPKGNVNPSSVGGVTPPSLFSRVDDYLSPWLVRNNVSALRFQAPGSF